MKTLKWLFFLMPCFYSGAQDSQTREKPEEPKTVITVGGSVNSPRIVATDTRMMLSDLIKQAQGTTRHSDTHRVTIAPEYSGTNYIRTVVIDAERLFENGLDYPVEVGSQVVVPELLVLDKDTEKFQRQIRRFTLSIEEARKRAIELAGNEPSIPEIPEFIIGDDYVFTGPTRQWPDTGCFVNGYNGRVKQLENGKTIRSAE